MSSNQKSTIFDHIMQYFIEYGDKRFDFSTSEKARTDSLVRHYHRPQLESKLISPCVATIHHDLNDSSASLALDKFIPRYQEADYLICLNKTQEKILHQNGIFNTVIIPHGFNENLIKLNTKEPKSWTGKIQLAIISRQYGRKVKGESYITEIAKYLNPNKFAFITIGQDRHLTADYLYNLGFDVTNFENIPYRIVADFYQKIDFLLMTSKYEGGPANIPEAIAAGIPIICNPIGMAKDYVKNNINGLYLSMDPEYDNQHIFNKICENDMHLKLKSGAISLAKTAITWQESIKMNCNVYMKIINNFLL